MASKYSLATWLPQELPNTQQTQVLSTLTFFSDSMLKLQFQYYTISPIFAKGGLQYCTMCCLYRTIALYPKAEIPKSLSYGKNYFLFFLCSFR